MARYHRAWRRLYELTVILRISRLHGPHAVACRDRREAIRKALDDGWLLESAPVELRDEDGRVLLDRSQLEAEMARHRDEWWEQRRREGAPGHRGGAAPGPPA